jgi:D-alanyl-D-alanine carboxypeptidase
MITSFGVDKETANKILLVSKENNDNITIKNIKGIDIDKIPKSILDLTLNQIEIKKLAQNLKNQINNDIQDPNLIGHSVMAAHQSPRLDSTPPMCGAGSNPAARATIQYKEDKCIKN